MRAKDGVPLEFAVSTTTGATQLREQCQQLMQQDWQQIGVGMKINNMPAAVIWGEFYTRSKFDSLLVGTDLPHRASIPIPRSRFGVGLDPRQERQRRQSRCSGRTRRPMR